MKGEEIANSTPWEIERRIEGYARRIKYKRIFTASFLTAPIINGGIRGPKRAISPQKLLPDDFRSETSMADKAEIAEIVRQESERRRKHGQPHD